MYFLQIRQAAESKPVLINVRLFIAEKHETYTKVQHMLTIDVRYANKILIYTRFFTRMRIMHAIHTAATTMREANNPKDGTSQALISTAPIAEPARSAE
jgi:hypothetical protein